MNACSGSSLQESPVGGLVSNLDPDDPQSVVGFTSIVSGLVAVPAGNPTFSVGIMATFLGVNGVGGASTVTWRIIDEFEGATTVLYSQTTTQPVSSMEDYAIITGATNLAAGNHRFILQVNSSEVPYTVPTAGILINVYKSLSFSLTEEP